jgi:transcription initiation factor TFIID subunit 5
MPAEDEGIPGHRPGNAISSTDPNVGNTLAALKLGKLQMEVETESDVRAESVDLDLQNPPAAGQASYVQTHEMVNIKQEDEDDGPTRAEIPYPPQTARDVAMEVQKIRENRDRFKIETRTGGIGPGISVCMYTLHNTKDSVTCIDFSGDYQLIAAGTSDSYIRVWSMDGKAIVTNDSVKPQASHRLIGHSGPVYAVSFAPSTTTPANSVVGTDTKWLLSCSADGTIRLWNLDIFQQVVVYKGHVGAVWSLEWGPQGHYFVSGGLDKTGRIWSTDKPRQQRILAGHDSDVGVVAWHPNSAYVFTAGYDKTVRMWAMGNGQPVRMFTGHTSPITALACSRNGKILASADDSGSIMLWDLGPGRLLKRMRGHGKGGIWSLSWSIESTVLVSGGADNTVRVWDVAGPPKGEATQKLPGEAGKVDGSGPAAGVSMGGTKKSKKDAVVTADQISAFLTKSTPVYRVKFTNMNLVLAGGLYLP